MAELADALDSGSSERKFMWVQVPSPAERFKSKVLWTFDLMSVRISKVPKETFVLRPRLKFQALDAGGNEFPRRF